MSIINTKKFKFLFVESFINENNLFIFIWYMNIMYKYNIFIKLINVLNNLINLVQIFLKIIIYVKYNRVSKKLFLLDLHL